MNDFDLYNTIVNNEIYLAITVLLSIIVVYSAVKKFIKWLILTLLFFIFYLGYLYYTGDQDTINDVDKIFESVKSDSEAFIKEKLRTKSMSLNNFSTESGNRTHTSVRTWILNPRRLPVRHLGIYKITWL